MSKIVTVGEMRQIEAAADASLLSYDQMMQNAGQAVALYLRRRLEVGDDCKITCLIGKGNNGGDGLVAARELASATKAQIRLYLLEARPDQDKNYAALKTELATIAFASDDQDHRTLTGLIASADIVIDALFGIGLRLPLRGHAAQVMRTVKVELAKRRDHTAELLAADPRKTETEPVKSRPFVLAIDCPSGIDCDGGEADPAALSADATITFIAAKPGLLTFPAAGHVGDLVVADIGISPDFPPLREVRRTLTDLPTVRSILPPRPIDGHKGTFGKVLTVGGSANYIGAVALAAESAYRAGAGLSTIATTQAIIDAVAGQQRESTYIALSAEDGVIAETNIGAVAEAAARYDAAVIGCGLGAHEATRSFLLGLLKEGGLPPLILDADALNILSERPQWWQMLPADTIITPHPGEMSRLCDLPTIEVNRRRWEIVVEMARVWNIVVLLKGAHTLIGAPDGAMAAIPFKTDALSTAGTGDVLAGIIAGSRAQGASAFDAARLGAYAHALAGTIAADAIGSSRSVMAGDVVSCIGGAFKATEMG